MKLPSPAPWTDDDFEISFLREIAKHLSLALPLPDLLKQVISFATTVVKCDSCFIYVLAGDELVLRASKNPHPEMVDRLKLKVGEGITGWVAEHREPVAVAMNAAEDPRFKLFNDLPEDYFEAFLSVPVVSRGRVVGVINLQNRPAAPIHAARGRVDRDAGRYGRRRNRDGAPGSEKSAPLRPVGGAADHPACQGNIARSLGINDVGADLILEQKPPQEQVVSGDCESLLLSEDLKPKN